MLNVVFASSNEYSPLLFISVTSLLEHNFNDFDFINIYVLDDGINENTKAKILQLQEKYTCKITFINTKFDSLDIKLVPISKKITNPSVTEEFLTTYTRLFASTLLPDDLEKVLFLDCDSLILGSYKELWDLDLSDYYCAGVIDTMNEYVKKLYGFNEEDSYVNAGVLFMNLEKWRKDNIEEKFLDFLIENQGKWFMMDQGVINNVLRNKIKIIEPKYNLMGPFQYHDYDIARKYIGYDTEYYSKEIVDESRKNPVFVHFSGFSLERPWNNKEHKYNKEFVKYAKKTGCEHILNYVEQPNLRTKLFYKGYNNIFIKLLLKLMPAKRVKDNFDNGAHEHFKKRSLETKEFYEN